MKVIFLILVISAILADCTSPDATLKPNMVSKPSLKIIDDSIGIITLLTEGKLLTAREDFKEALLEKNFNKLKGLSADCINCYSCDTSRYVPIDAFFKKYFNHTFDSNFLSRMTDTAKVDGHYDSANWHIYSQDSGDC